MNTYTYNEISVGQRESFSVTVGAEQMKLFCKITGDTNPRHTEQGVFYGMLTGSFLSTLAGIYLPGKYSLIQTVRLEFVNPAILSSSAAEIKLIIAGTVTSKEDRFSLITMKVSICGEDGIKFLFGTMKVKVADSE